MLTTLIVTLALAQQAAAPTNLEAGGIAPAGTVHVGDIADVKGIRTNALFGTGLVVGLNKTGDLARATRKALANLLSKHRLDIDIQELKDGSAALVMVTATLQPFSREGDRLDITVSTTGGAKSLFGGQLLLTPLYGADGAVYAVGQGPVAIGGFQASGAASSVVQNHPTVGLVARGATVEADVDTRFMNDDGMVEIRLRNPDFTTAGRVVEAINTIHRGAAFALDPAAIRVSPPKHIPRRNMVDFVSSLLAARVTPYQRARVLVNEKTGTIIAGSQVRISSVAIAHGNLTVTIAESPVVSQPQAFSNGTTTVVPRTDINAEVSTGNGVSVLPSTASIGELANALNALGATPRDLITILQNLEQAGALHAQLEVQ